MICPTCRTANDNENVFCVNCGGAIGGGTQPVVQDTVRFGSGGRIPAPPTVATRDPGPPSAETVGVPFAARATGGERYYDYDSRDRPSRAPLFIGIAIGLVALLLIGGGIVALVVLRPGTGTATVDNASAAEALPDHLGLFVQSRDKTRVDELRRQDLTNAVEGRDAILKSTLQTIEFDPSLILYSSGSDIPITDLRLIQLDTVKPDGSLQQIDFQAAPVDGKPDMKRIRIPDGIANGKYAFALLDGFLNEGNHKFWPFEVRDSSKAGNGAALKTVTVAVKAKQQTLVASSKPKVPPPAGGSIAYSTTGNLVLRSEPSQFAPKIRNLARGERVFVIRYSSNVETFNGKTYPFALVQTEYGETGWAFAAYLRQ
jgi:hypothetical protein